MKGTVAVIKATGEVESSLVSDDGETQVAPEMLDKIGQTLTYLVQDVNLYQKSNGGEQTLGQLQRISMKLDSAHFMNVVCLPDRIMATVEQQASSPQ